jgi:hypothetical protein
MKAPKTRWLREHVSYVGDNCLVWPFKKNKNGYGAITNNKKTIPVHRFMCILAHGEPPDVGLEASHSCGNRICVNPRHLRWKTSAENSQEKHEHGTMAVGERNGNSSLTEADVIKIKSMRGSLSQRKIAKMFGVSQATVNRLQLGIGWNHIQPS